MRIQNLYSVDTLSGLKTICIILRDSPALKNSKLILGLRLAASFQAKRHMFFKDEEDVKKGSKLCSLTTVDNLV